ncbi:hypothetical protein EVAR_28438_1 [Eumeta japonica]|uniref:Uncharacterized protein n=1 Tax=Eumeta variegata TaxID=151549 RepID=A0A4C1V820_EUMVA|nr:hypothetical protein EVAR_28438_1 [Eumeta japonica]
MMKHSSENKSMARGASRRAPVECAITRVRARPRSVPFRNRALLMAGISLISARRHKKRSYKSIRQSLLRRPAPGGRRCRYSHNAFSP